MPRRGSGGRAGRRRARRCHVPSLAPRASCRASARKSAGKWQTGLTGFTRSALDATAHYHNHLQRGGGTCRDPRPPPPGRGQDPECTAGAEPRSDCGRRPPADPAVRAGRGTGPPTRALRALAWGRARVTARARRCALSGARATRRPRWPLGPHPGPVRGMRPGLGARRGACGREGVAVRGARVENAALQPPPPPADTPSPPRRPRTRPAAEPA